MRKFGFVLASLLALLLCLSVQAQSQPVLGISPASTALSPEVTQQSGQPRSANELLSDLVEVLQTLKAETSNSVTSSETQLQKLLEIMSKLTEEVSALQTSKANLAEVSEIFRALSEISGRLSTEFLEIQTKSGELTSSLKSLSTSFETFKTLSDKALTQSRIDVLAAQKTARIAMMAAGVGIGAGIGFVVAGALGAAAGAALGALAAAFIQ